MRRARPQRRGQLTSYRWQKLRLSVIKEEPVCRLRLSCCTRWSTTADHIIPVSHRPDLKYVRQNLRGSCQPCNLRRKARPLSEVRAEDELLRKPAPVAPAALEFFR
jgi:5-methylcytosine-specific restriction endonuclease McrA